MILTVTPGINLSSVTGPISKAQLNQLGQPTVALSPGSVVAADTNFSSLRCTDGSYPFYELYNTAAPVDKKFLKLGAANDGWVYLQRINDAYTAVAATLLSWDAANTTNFSFPVAITTANATLATFSGSPGASGFTGIRVQCADASAAAVKIAFLDFANETGTNVAALWTGFETDGSTNLRLLTTPAGSRSGDRRVERVRITGDGNVGIGTNTPAARLHVVGGDALIENNRKLGFLDTAGGYPAMICQSDNNFVFYGTNSTGGGRVIYTCAMRSDTSAFQVNVPLKIGASGVAFKSVLKATVTQTPNGGSPLNAGTLYNVSSTVTGALPGALIVIRGIGSNWQNIQVTAECGTADSVIVYYLNAGSSSFTIGATPLDLYVFNT
jgi:hypothetical protein